MTEKDVLRDFRDRLLTAFSAGESFTEEVVIAIERECRSDWVGDRSYIASDPDVDRKRQAALEAVSRGARPEEAASESGLSRRTIYRLLARRSF